MRCNAKPCYVMWCLRQAHPQWRTNIQMNNSWMQTKVKPSINWRCCQEDLQTNFCTPVVGGGVEICNEIFSDEVVQFSLHFNEKFRNISCVLSPLDHGLGNFFLYWEYLKVSLLKQLHQFSKQILYRLRWEWGTAQFRIRSPKIIVIPVTQFVFRPCLLKYFFRNNPYKHLLATEAPLTWKTINIFFNSWSRRDGKNSWI